MAGSPAAPNSCLQLSGTPYVPLDGWMLILCDRGRSATVHAALREHPRAQGMRAGPGRDRDDGRTRSYRAEGANTCVFPLLNREGAVSSVDNSDSGVQAGMLDGRTEGKRVD